MDKSVKYFKATSCEVLVDGVPIGETSQLSYQDCPEYAAEPEDVPISFGTGLFDFEIVGPMPDWLKDMLKRTELIREWKRKRIRHRKVFEAHVVKITKIARKKLKKKYGGNWKIKVSGYGRKY